MEVLPLSLSKEQPLVYNIDSYMWDCGDLNKFASGGELWPVSNARSKASYNSSKTWGETQLTHTNPILSVLTRPDWSDIWLALALRNNYLATCGEAAAALQLINTSA